MTEEEWVEVLNAKRMAYLNASPSGGLAALTDWFAAQDAHLAAKYPEHIRRLSIMAPASTYLSNLAALTYHEEPQP